MKKAYSFKKKGSTEEIHIFEGAFTNSKECNANTNSICNKMKNTEGTWINLATCLDEQQAREKAAGIGRDVCGDCVSHLYKSY